MKILSNSIPHSNINNITCRVGYCKSLSIISLYCYSNDKTRSYLSFVMNNSIPHSNIKKVHIEWATVSHSHSDETLMNHMLSFSHKILNAKTFVYKKMMDNSIQHTTQYQQITYRAGYRESCSTISLYLTTVMHSPPLETHWHWCAYTTFGHSFGVVA